MRTAVYSGTGNDQYGGAYPVYLSDGAHDANGISVRLDGSAHAQWRVIAGGGTQVQYTTQTSVIDTKYYDPKPADYFSCALGVWCM